MDLLPQTDTISNLKNNQATVLAKVSHHPVLLLQNSKPIAVLVSPEEWNRTALRLRELERNEIIRQRFQAAQHSQEPDLTLEEFMSDLEASES